LPSHVGGRAASEGLRNATKAADAWITAFYAKVKNVKADLAAVLV